MMTTLGQAAIFLAFLFPAFAAEDNKVQVGRFQSSINTLKTAFTQEATGELYDIKKVATQMGRGSKRVASFKLQALGKIYSEYDGSQGRKFFRSSIRFEFKTLEDGIGEVKKWRDILKSLENMTNPPQNRIEKAKLRKAVAIEILKYILTNDKSFIEADGIAENLNRHNKRFISGYNQYRQRSLYKDTPWFPYSSQSKLQRIEKDLNAYSWKSYDKDREFVVEHLRIQLQEVEDTPFNFNLLEDTSSEKGLHEYRREMRWFSLKADVLNGTVNFIDNPDDSSDNANDCPVDELQNIVNDPDLMDSKYSKLPFTPFAEDENVCKISRCLFYKVADIVSKVGTIKDEVEEGLFAGGGGNETPPEAAEAVEKIHKQMNDLKLIQNLRKQLKSCI